jgi:hypothetical protein
MTLAGSEPVTEGKGKSAWAPVESCESPRPSVSLWWSLESSLPLCCWFRWDSRSGAAQRSCRNDSRPESAARPVGAAAAAMVDHRDLW